MGQPEGRWWTAYRVGVTSMMVEIYGEPQTVEAQTYHLPPSRRDGTNSWRAEGVIPVAEITLAAFGATEEDALQRLREDVTTSWEARIQKQRAQPPTLAEELGITTPDDVHANESWVSIHWDRERGCIHADWKGYANSVEFRASTMKILEAIRERSAGGLVSDNRRLEGVTERDQLWLRDSWVPEAVTAGVRRIAVILPHHGLGKVASEEIISRFGKTEFVTRTFESLDEGKAWVGAVDEPAQGTA